MAWSAASARALLEASPIAAGGSTVIRGESITAWLKITLVPLLLFLIGACIWGCIQNTAAWRVLTEDRGGSARNEALGEGQSDSPKAISNNEAAEDLETGLELSQVRCRDEGRAAVASNEVLVPSRQMRPWMETLAPFRHRRETRLAVDKELRLVDLDSAVQHDALESCKGYSVCMQ